ncbi:MAG: SAM-dependent methyltransferase [Bacteroidota bacterium]
MSNIQNTSEQKDFWSLRYEENRTGWDIGYPSTPIKTYIDQIENKEIKILIPGAGNAYEAEYLFHQGYKNVDVVDIASAPLEGLQKRVSDFPKSQMIQVNFFEHEGQYDLILEQTFFCSFPPNKENRKLYAKTMHSLLAKNGKLVGVWFDFPLSGDMVKRPFGGDRAEYLTYLSPYFDVQIFEKCYNSIPPRAGTELFGIFQKK